ncbi:MAG: hypothetical protein AAF985_15730, partial [Bacteroidota bacterium]
MDEKENADKLLHSITLRAGFTSYKFIPYPFVISTNNFNPKLEFYPNHISFRGGFYSRKLAYRDIDQIDIRIHSK